MVEDEQELAQILEQSIACVHWYRPANKQRPAAAKLTPSATDVLNGIPVVKSNLAQILPAIYGAVTICSQAILVLQPILYAEEL